MDIFFYDNRNLTLLGIPEILNDKHEIFGTAYNKTQGKIELIKKSITDTKKIRRLEISDCDCLQLLREYPPI